MGYEGEGRRQATDKASGPPSSSSTSSSSTSTSGTQTSSSSTSSKDDQFEQYNQFEQYTDQLLAIQFQDFPQDTGGRFAHPGDSASTSELLQEAVHIQKPE